MPQAYAVRTYNSERLIERHAMILEAARAELSLKGFHGVTMQGLAERAGVTKKTLYNVYGSKDQLLVTAISEVIDQYRDVSAEGEPGIPAIITSRRAAVAKVVDSPEYASAMTSALIQAQSDDRLIELLIKDTVTWNHQQLEQASAKGELAGHVETGELAEQLTSLAWGQILLNYKDVLTIQAFAGKALLGTLQLLLGATRGERHRWVEEQINRERD
jgi:AcrR family transcriptional regulator